jgi:hypothetical protein
VKDPRPDKTIWKAMLEGNAGKGGACADENLLSAYLEGLLQADEKSRLERHASDCACCRKVLGLAMKMAESEVPARNEALEEAPTRTTVLFRVSIPVVGLAAVLFFVIAGAVVFRSAFKARQAAEPARIAAARTGAPEISQATPGEVQQHEKDTGLARPPRVEATVESRPAEVRAQARAESLTPPPPVERALADQAKKTAPKDAETAATAESRPQWQPVAASELPAKAAKGAAAEPLAGPVGAILTAEDRTGSKDRKDAAAKPPEPQKAGYRAAVLPAAAQEEKLAPPLQRSAYQVLRAFITERGKPAADEVAVRRVAGRVFHGRGEYWVDQDCARAPRDAAIVEVGTDSPQYREIEVRDPEIARLMEPGKRILIFWEGTILLIR